MPLSTHLDYDIKGILSLGPRLALPMAQHTLRRLEEMEAPEDAFKKLLSECFLKMPELSSGWIIQAQARDFFRLAATCAQHTSDLSLKGQVVLICRRFRDYKLLKETVRQLADRPLSQFEFREIAELTHVTSRDFNEVTTMMCIDAYEAHGEAFRNEVKQILVKKHGEWVEAEIDGVAAV
jgi:hypothetical protein